MTDNPVVVLDGLIEAARRQLDGLIALRSSMASETAETYTDDFAEENLISASMAAHRSGVSKQTIRRWVHDHGIGIGRGGRLYVSVPRLRRHMGDDA